jgi:short-subunit dehydrogenase
VASISRTVVITGASSGIGKALALRHARERGRLGLLGRDRERLGAVAEECQALGAAVETASLDVRARSGMEQWLQSFDARGPIDVLIANAGVMTGRPADTLLEPPAAGYAAMEINVLGILNTVQPILPRMLARRHGQIGIVSSLAAFAPLPDAPTYSAAKAAVLNYGLALRHQLQSSGVGVSVICPGYVETPMLRQETGRKPFAMSAEAAADCIVRGIERNRSIIAFPFLFAVMARLGNLVPGFLQRPTLPRFTVRNPLDLGGQSH